MTDLLRAEWTKFVSVRGWVFGLLGSVFAMVVVSALSASGDRPHCTSGCPSTVAGPDGEAVADSYYLVHRQLAGAGTITVEVTSLTGLLPPPHHAFGRPIPPAVPLSAGHSGRQPWAKAGLIVTASTTPGAPYAAVMTTGAHGIRMQYDYTHDVAGEASGKRWLRLRRAGDSVTGYESADGVHWKVIGTTHVPGLPARVQAGLFVTSPLNAQITEHPFVSSGAVGPTLATATFAHLARRGAWSPGGWQGTDIGGPNGAYPALSGGVHRSGNAFTVSGSGDIAPQVSGVEGFGVTVDHTLAGEFAGLIAVAVLGAMFVTAEYRRGLIRTTLLASPRRGRVLLAKAVVVGSLTFLAGLVGTTISLILGHHILQNVVYPVSTGTEIRVIAGTAAILTGTAVAALGLGAMARRSSAAITAIVVAIVLPYLLFPGLPATAAEWLLRLTPAAAFAVQQTVPVYAQVANSYTPVNGYYPLAPRAGLAVLGGYAALALVVAIVLLRRRDA